MKILVLDSGFNVAHSVFSQLKVVAAYDFVHNDTNVHDEAGEEGIFHVTVANMLKLLYRTWCTWHWSAFAHCWKQAWHFHGNRFRRFSAAGEDGGYGEGSAR